MDCFTIKLVSIFFIVIENIVLILPQVFSRKHLEGEWENAISEIVQPPLYQNGTEKKLTSINGRNFGGKKKDSFDA